mgnify:CR=1 FL=1
MKDVEKMLEGKLAYLQDLKEELNLLEKEKQQLVLACEKSKENSREKLEQQMEKSEKDYVRLLDEARVVKKEIETIKKKYC